MSFAEFLNENVDYYFYSRAVQETLKELFGTNVTLEKKTYINCSNSYYYIKEFSGFVEGKIAIGSSSFSEQLQVYNFENICETVYVYAKWMHTYLESNYI